MRLGHVRVPLAGLACRVASPSARHQRGPDQTAGMPRLADADAVAEGQVQFPVHLRGPESRELTSALRRYLLESIRDVPVIVVDNVEEWLLHQALEGRTDIWSYTEDLPCLAAPYPVFWLESRAPAGAPNGGYRAWGALVRAHDFSEIDGSLAAEYAAVAGSTLPHWMLLGTMVYDRGPEGILAGVADWSM